MSLTVNTMMISVADIPAWLWQRVAAVDRLLMLDYDGTLAPLKVCRDDAAPDLRTLDLARQVASSPRTTLAIVSGRPIHEIARWVGRLPAWLVGEHGWEHRSPDGDLSFYPVPLDTRDALKGAAEAAIEHGWDPLLERKRTALVLHVRGLPQQRAADLLAQCDEVWRGWTSPTGLRLSAFDGGLELRAIGHDKGTAVRELIGTCPAGTFAVYVGDDVTDEDAFRELRETGFGILVGQRKRPTMALGRLGSRDAIPELLEVWLALVEKTPADGEEEL